MLTSAKPLTPRMPHDSAFTVSASRSSRRSSFGILRADKTSSAACYGMIALVALAGIVVNLIVIVRSVLNIMGAAQ